MRLQMGMRVAIILLCSLVIGCESPSGQSSEKEPLIVFLVRHAEKVDNSDNPELSEAGKERAKTLSEVLRNTGLEHIHSTDYIRTRNTALPVAEVFGLDIEIYDPANLNALVDKLLNTRSRHLVVGHSNTTPIMVELLGGNPGTLINEGSEYDRLYVITFGGDNKANGILLRYGELYQN